MVDPYQPEQWHDFFLATAGAAAALTGLLFVAISLHIRTVATDPRYRGLARGSLIGLVIVLVNSLVGLVHQPSAWAGLEFAGVSVAYIALSGAYQLASTRGRRIPTANLVASGIGYLLALGGLLGGLSVAFQAGPGLFVVALILVAIVLWNLWDAWVLLLGVADEEIAKGTPGL